MSFHSYKASYINFLKSLSQTQITSIIADHVFDEFPQRLPEKLKHLLLERFDEFQSIYAQVVSEDTESELSVSKLVQEENNFTEEEDCPDKIERIVIKANSKINANEFMLRLPEEDRLFRCIFEAAFLCDRDRVLDGDYQPFRNFSPMIPRYQALVMNFAYLEAFLSDTVQTICVSRPEVLRMGGKKTVTWDTVLSFSDPQDARKHFIEETTNEFRQKPIKERLKSLRENYGLNISIKSKEERELEIFQQKRNLVIHNGCLIDKKYVNETNGDPAEIGKPFALSVEDVDRCSHVVGVVGSSVFKSVSLKYLGANADNFSDLLIFV